MVKRMVEVEGEVVLVVGDGSGGSGDGHGNCIEGTTMEWRQIVDIVIIFSSFPFFWLRGKSMNRGGRNHTVCY